MVVLLHDIDILTWLWHDAEIYSLKTDWAKDGELSVRLRCKMNPDEDQQPLRELGIQSALLDVYFQNTLTLKTTTYGCYSARDVVYHWEIIGASPLLDELRDKFRMKIEGLIHHHIQCSGSTLDIVCTNIGLEEIPKLEVAGC